MVCTSCNPVHQMPLVEIIRGKDTSDETIAAVVAYAAKMGKSPIVVNDCPGFYVNRVLFPYFAGFSKLVLDGADFAKVDKVMEKTLGWPMGPAYLLDVVSFLVHCPSLHRRDGSWFPNPYGRKSITTRCALMYQAQRYGQKNGCRFLCVQQRRQRQTEKRLRCSSL